MKFHEVFHFIVNFFSDCSGAKPPGQTNHQPKLGAEISVRETQVAEFPAGEGRKELLRERRRDGKTEGRCAQIVQGKGHVEKEGRRGYQHPVGSYILYIPGLTTIRKTYRS